MPKPNPLDTLDLTSIRACCAPQPPHIHLPPGIPVEEAISVNGTTWAVGSVIGVGFLEGTSSQHDKVVRWANYWTQFANIKFDFGSSSPLIRIAFRPNQGSYSLIGTGCRYVRSGPTMNFGWVTDGSDDTSDRAVIVHEFGHALGLGHEQSSPLNDIKWDKAKALAYFMRSQGWTADMVQSNVFDVYAAVEVTGTPYDRSSIMQYPVDASLTLDGRGIGWNTDLSALDKSYIATLYPGVGVSPPVVVPPVVPPAPTQPIPAAKPTRVAIDGLPARAKVPAPFQPALFTFTIARRHAYRLSASVDGPLPAPPIVDLTPNGRSPIRLALGAAGKGVFALGPGKYTCAVYNGHANLTGTANLKVATA